MKITDVQTVLLTGPNTADPYFLEARRLRSAALIAIHTDGPHSGVGETYTGYYDATTRSAVPAHTTSAIVEIEASKAELMRRHVGPNAAILMDGHMGNPLGDAWDLSTARAVLKALEPFDLFFFEEPLPYTDPWGYGELNRTTSIPIAGGECLTTLDEFRQFADQGGFAIAQPDAAWVGGLAEFMRIARMFDSRKQKIATHSWGAGVAQMQNIHAGFATSN